LGYDPNNAIESSLTVIAMAIMVETPRRPRSGERPLPVAGRRRTEWQCQNDVANFAAEMCEQWTNCHMQYGEPK